jgi:uncharacterized protein
MLDQKLLDIIACPIGKTPLTLVDDKYLECKCGLKFKIENDIPIMLIDEAIAPEGFDFENPSCKKE